MRKSSFWVFDRSYQQSVKTLNTILQFALDDNWTDSLKMLAKFVYSKNRQISTMASRTAVVMRMQEPQKQDILFYFQDSLDRLEIIEEIIYNLDANNESIFDDFGSPEDEFFSLTHNIHYQTQELSDSFYSMRKKYEIILKIIRFRKSIESLRATALTQHNVWISEIANKLGDETIRNILKLPGNTKINTITPQFLLSTLDHTLESLILKTVHSFPLTAGAVPEGLYYHPYARGKHPSQTIVSRFYKQVFTFENSKGKKLIKDAPLIVGSSFMGVFNALLVCLINEKNIDQLGIAFYNQTYFEVLEMTKDNHTLFGYTKKRRRPRIKLIRENKTEDAFKLADILYINAIPNSAVNKIEYLDNVIQAAKSYTNITTLIIDITLDPFLDLLKIKRTIQPTDHQLIILINSLTKFAQSGLNTSVGGSALILSKAGSKSNTRATDLKEAMNKILTRLGAHMDSKLAVSIQTNRDSAQQFFNRLKKNSITLTDWLRKSMAGKAEIFHARNAKTCAPLIYIKILNNSLDPADGDPFYTFFKESSEVWKARIKTQEAPLESRSKMYANYILLCLHSWFSTNQEDVGRTLVRFGTSFGFSRTTIMTIAYPDKDHIYLRIAPGLEELETLWMIRCGITALLPKWWEQ